MKNLRNIGNKHETQNQELLSKASTFWNFLEDLAANDPAAYQDFIYKNKQTQSKLINSTQNSNSKTQQKAFDEFDKSIQTAKQILNGTNPKPNQYYFTPIPVLVIKTRITSTKDAVQTLLNVNDYRNLMKKGHKLYINFLRSPFCKPLQSKSKPNTTVTDSTPISDILVPIQVSKIINEDKDDNCWRCDIVYHNTIYDRFNDTNNKSQIFTKWIIEYALRQIEAQNTIKLIRDYKILKKKKFIGKTAPNPQFIADKKKDRMTETQAVKKSITAQSNGKAKANKNGNILKFMSSNDGADDDSKCITEKKSVLIPKYRLSVDDKKSVIKVVIELEKENDFKDIQLDMNETKLLLKSTHYKLEIVFPMNVDDTVAKAKFDKKKHCLKLKLPITQ